MGTDHGRTDGELLAAYSAGGSGSGAAFEALVVRHGGMIHAACLRILGNRAAAEDAAQAVLLVLARKAGSVRGSLPAFLHGVAMRVSACQRRSEMTRSAREREAAEMAVDRMESDTRGPDQDWGEVQAHIDAAIARLPSAQREVVVLRYLGARNNREVSRELGISEGAAATHLNRALERMRGFLRRRGIGLPAAALPAMLAAQAGHAACPGYLAAAAKGLASVGMGSGSTAVSGNVASLAKGAMQMMFWAKVKVAAAVLGGVLLLGGGALTANRMAAGEPAVAPSGQPGGDRREKDFTGKEWVLNDWKDGDRPYKKDLAGREAEYRKKWGENWQDGSLQSTGDWNWEPFAVFPGFREKYVWKCVSHGYPWPGGGAPQVLVFAPNGGEKITDIWVTGGRSFIWVDPSTKQPVVIGVGATPLPVPTEGRQFPIREKDGCVDGLDGTAALEPAQTTFGAWSEICPITGRVFFMQLVPKGSGRPQGTLRYVQRLLPYTVNGREMLLPAYLESGKMYEKLGAKPVVDKDGKRPPSRFVVRTTPITGLDTGWFSQVLLSPDGKGIWKDTDLIDVETGATLKQVKLQGPAPTPIAQDGHNGYCVGFDGMVYRAMHTGCSGGPGRMVAFGPDSDRLITMYDSTIGWDPKQAKSPAGYRELVKAIGTAQDGPADGRNLMFCTTCFSFACPRTGAIMTGGWDGHGIRRYHDGFVTWLTPEGGRRGWQKKDYPGYPGNFKQCRPSVTPGGDLYVTAIGIQHVYGSSGSGGSRRFRSDEEKEKYRQASADLQIVRIFRTDWPKEQPVNGYANQFLSPEKREELMLHYCKKYIADYAEMSKIY